MALYRIGLSILDSDGHTSRLEHYADEASAAAAETRALALAPLVDALIGGQIVEITVTSVIALPGGLKSAAAAGSDVEVKGKFVWNVAGGYTSITSLPTFRKDNFTVSGGDINTANITVSAYVDEIVQQGYSDYRETDITGLRQAYEAFRGRQRS